MFLNAVNPQEAFTQSDQQARLRTFTTTTTETGEATKNFSQTFSNKNRKEPTRVAYESQPKVIRARIYDINMKYRCAKCKDSLVEDLVEDLCTVD